MALLSIILPFPKCYIFGIIQFHIDFFHLVIHIDVSTMSFHGLTAHFFLTLNSIPLPGYTIVHLFIHLHHGCSQVLAIMNSAAIHICAQVFVWT